MADWLTYSLTDFLPFSRTTYLRLFELHDARFWPAVAIGLLMGLALLWLAYSRTPARLRIALALLGGCWAWIGWAFLWQSYTPLLWAAPYAGVAFGLQGLLLLWAASRLPATTRPSVAGLRASIGYALLAYAVMISPLVGLWFERSWSGLELFGSAPDPTTLATLGVLTLVRHPLGPILLPIPLAWALFSGLTLLAMDDPLWPLLPSAALAALLMAITQGRGKLA